MQINMDLTTSTYSFGSPVRVGISPRNRGHMTTRWQSTKSNYSLSDHGLDDRGTSDEIDLLTSSENLMLVIDRLFDGIDLLTSSKNPMSVNDGSSME